VSLEDARQRQKSVSAELPSKDRGEAPKVRRSGEASTAVITELRSYLAGWKAYFRLAQTPGVFADLDGWIRHRLRALQLVHWKRGTTAYRELRKLGAAESVAGRVAKNLRRWWRNSGMLLNTVLDTRYYDRQGLPRLSC
jgi:RNA-directed DNA polymerase